VLEVVVLEGAAQFVGLDRGRDNDDHASIGARMDDVSMAVDGRHV